MDDFIPKDLDRVIHAPIRLGIMTILNYLEEVSFNYLKSKMKVTDGNLSSHLSKLEDSGYINVRKEFIKKKPYTSYHITEKGKKAFRNYLQKLESVIKGGQ
jgi:DNA-binding MarR family transcriptional regulator